MILTDDAGAEIGLVPITLTSGQDSPPVTIRATLPPGTVGTGYALRATIDASAPSVKLMGRIKGSGAGYADLNANPISLDPYAGTLKDFDIIARAGAGLSGFTRASLTLGAARGTGAGWAV